MAPELNPLQQEVSLRLTVPFVEANYHKAMAALDAERRQILELGYGADGSAPLPASKIQPQMPHRTYAWVYSQLQDLPSVVAHWMQTGFYGLPQRETNFLHRHGIESVEELYGKAKTMFDLGLGKTGYSRIEACLTALGRPSLAPHLSSEQRRRFLRG